MEYFVYILYSEKLDRYYTGYTYNLERRLYELISGHENYTRLGIPWVLEYTLKFSSQEEARSEELRIKKRKSRSYLIRLINEGRASRT